VAALRQVVGDEAPACAPPWCWPRALWVTGTVLLVVMLVHLVALLVMGGPWTGPVSLRKPATFAETGWLLSRRPEPS